MPEVQGRSRPFDVDPDRDRRRAILGEPVSVLAAVSVGGGVGGLARYAVSTAFPAPPGAFPWSTFVTNVSGCLLIGVLMVLVTEVWPGRRLLRPFLGVGVLGGYTTFSTYVLDIQTLLESQRPALALSYLAATVVAGLSATWSGMSLTRGLVHRGRRR